MVKPRVFANTMRTHLQIMEAMLKDPERTQEEKIEHALEEIRRCGVAVEYFCPKDTPAASSAPQRFTLPDD